MINVKKKLNERKVTKLYASVITLAQQLGKTEWTTPIETNNGTLYVTIKFSESDESKPESLQT